MKKLTREFYLRDTHTVARELLGKYLVKETAHGPIAGRIRETEAYVGATDKACHAYGHTNTPRGEVMYGPGGYAYVYFVYGMYFCLNVVAEETEVPCAVLIRWADVVQGLDAACGLRYGKPSTDCRPKELQNLSNGPGKLCKAFSITKAENGMDLCGDSFYITDGIDGVADISFQIETGKRIGIGYAEEAVDFPWRYYYNETE